MSAVIHKRFLETSHELSPSLHGAIKSVGPVKMRRRNQRPLPEVLCRIVSGQQLSVKAASTIWGRIVESAGDTPLTEYIENVPPDSLRECGLSRSKTKAMKAIVQADSSGWLNVKELSRLDHNARSQRLVEIWGVGQWTADIVGISYFGDQDVWPESDVTVWKTLEKLTSRRRKPARTASHFAPHRTYLALYMWKYADAILRLVKLRKPTGVIRELPRWPQRGRGPSRNRQTYQGAGMMSLNRRDLIRYSVAAAPCALLSPVAGASDRSAVVVDTHLHCFAGSDARFPYHAQAPYRPTAAATPEHLLACMDGARVDHAVIVHPEPYQDDHRYLEHCLDVCGPRVKATCLFFADRPGSVDGMPRLLNKYPDQIVAARVHAYAPGRLPPFGTEKLRALWRSATELGLAIQLHFEPRYAPLLQPLISEFRETMVIIDHLGRPMQGTVEEHEVVVGWSAFPNVVMKIAALPDQNKYPHRDVRPIVKRLTDHYGADRMIYGGGFSSDATPESYRQYRQKVESLLAHLSIEDRAKILGETAASLFGFA